MSQNERLLNHLQNNGSINPMQAWQELGIYRLAARVKNLRDDGYHVVGSKVEVPNRFGEVCRVAEYKIES